MKELIELIDVRRAELNDELGRLDRALAALMGEEVPALEGAEERLAAKVAEKTQAAAVVQIHRERAKPKFKPRKCVDCQREFTPKATRTKRCDDCRDKPKQPVVKEDKTLAEFPSSDEANGDINQGVELATPARGGSAILEAENLHDGVHDDLPTHAPVADVPANRGWRGESWDEEDED